jgi:hypothetical protein
VAILAVLSPNVEPFPSKPPADRTGERAEQL